MNICRCCEGLFFIESVVRVSMDDLKEWDSGDSNYNSE